jgi:hypothetical protein
MGALIRLPRVRGRSVTGRFDNPEGGAAATSIRYGGRILSALHITSLPLRFSGRIDLHVGGRGNAQALCVARRWRAEHATILARKLRRAVIAD